MSVTITDYLPFFGFGINGDRCPVKNMSFIVRVYDTTGTNIFNRTYSANEANLSVGCTDSNCTNIKISMSFSIDASIRSGYTFFIFGSAKYLGLSTFMPKIIGGTLNTDAPSGLQLNLTLYESTGNATLNYYLVQALNSGELKFVATVAGEDYEGTYVALAHSDVTFTFVFATVSGISTITLHGVGNAVPVTRNDLPIVSARARVLVYIYDNTCTNMTNEYADVIGDITRIYLLDIANTVSDYIPLGSAKIEFVNPSISVTTG